MTLVVFPIDTNGLATPWGVTIHIPGLSVPRAFRLPLTDISWGLTVPGIVGLKVSISFEEQ